MFDRSRRQVDAVQIGTSFRKALMVCAQSNTDFENPLSPGTGKVREGNDIRLQRVALLRLMLIALSGFPIEVEVFAAGGGVPEIPNRLFPFFHCARTNSLKNPSGHNQCAGAPSDRTGCCPSMKAFAHSSIHITAKMEYAASVLPDRSAATSRATAFGSNQPRSPSVFSESRSSINGLSGPCSHARNGAPNPVLGR